MRDSKLIGVEILKMSVENIVNETVFYDKDKNVIWINSQLYQEYMSHAVAFGFEKENIKQQKEVFKKAIELREYRITLENLKQLPLGTNCSPIEVGFFSFDEDFCKTPQTIREFVYPSEFIPTLMEEVLLYFFDWAYDENNMDKAVKFLQILRDFACENMIPVKADFEEYKIAQMHACALRGIRIDAYITRELELFLSRFEVDDNLKSIKALYEYPYIFAKEFEACWINVEENTKSIKELFTEIVEKVLPYYQKFSKYVEIYKDEITNNLEHISNEAMFASEYMGDAEYANPEYDYACIERDYLILRSQYIKQGGDILNGDPSQVTEAEERLRDFFTFRENKMKEMYIEGVSSCLRKVLFVLCMTKDLLEQMLKTKSILLSGDTEWAKELYDRLKVLCAEIEGKVYEGYDEDVQNMFDTISLKGVKALRNVYIECNRAISEYEDFLRNIWENETLEELQNTRMEKIAELKRRIPNYSEEKLEGTLELYREILESKVDDENLYSRIENQCTEKYLNQVIEKVNHLYKKHNYKGKSVFQKQDIKTLLRLKFIYPLYTGEYLYQRYCKQESKQEFDYSSIAVEYYAAMEYFMNVVIFIPLKELYLDGLSFKEKEYLGYMSEETYNTLKKNKFKTCMYGSFGYLFNNIENEPKLLSYLYELSGSEKNEKEFIREIKLLGQKISSRNGDDIAKRRNASAHGGNILTSDNAVEARAIVYEVDESNIKDMVPHLRKTFEDVLKLLNIEWK